MHFATLASGSSGNATLVGEGERNFLIDCGLSAKRLLTNLSMINISSTQIEGIIVTHEHADHIKGVGILARKLKIPIYTTQGIWEEMEHGLGKIETYQKQVVERDLCLGGLKVSMFATSHDSRESYGLKIAGKRLSLGVATDSGTILEEMHRNMIGCDAYIVEANHDTEKLWQGRYPWYLKKRITGSLGHLSNIQLAEVLTEWIQDNTKRVVLAHLSEENNTPELALTSVCQILKEAGIPKRCRNLGVRVAPRYIPHELIVLEE